MFVDTFREVIDLNDRATDYALGLDPNAELDNQVASLVLRNPAVAVERLSSGQFSHLRDVTIDAVIDAANHSKQFVSSADASLNKGPVAQDVQQYYDHVLNPLLVVQHRVHAGDYDGSNATTLAAIKRSILLGSIAFEAIVTDPGVRYIRGIVQSKQYFLGNAMAAIEHAQRLGH